MEDEVYQLTLHISSFRLEISSLFLPQPWVR